MRMRAGAREPAGPAGAREPALRAGARESALRAGARRGRWLLVLAAVLLLHAAVVWWLDEVLVGSGVGQQPMPPRIEAAFVRTLAPTDPAPVAVAAAPAAPKPRRARRAAAMLPAASAASAPEMAATAPVVAAAAEMPRVEEPPPAVIATEATEPVATEPGAAVASAPAASAPGVVAFEWPPSTRLTYTLVGNYRGEVHGNARVQWVRLGERYQVHLDVTVGPSFAPLMGRTMTSDGELGDGGLVPRRYDEATKLPFQSPRRVTMAFTPETVTLGNGSMRPAPPGVQDTASQFVHLTWLFTTQPQLLRVGNQVEVPLALPRRVDRWVYEVVAEERLATPVGALDTFHLKPRRIEERPRGELSAEVWFAPSLQYLPVRIRIRQDAETYIDLMMDAAPLQAAPSESPPAATPAAGR
jgi:hypothetical protein